MISQTRKKSKCVAYLLQGGRASKLDEMKSYLWHVTGRVQGVGFRNYIRKHARRLGVAGYAMNLADGSVSVRGVGDGKALEQLAQYVRRGPMLAEVNEFEQQEAEPASYDGFDIR